MIISNTNTGGHWYTRDGDPQYTQMGLNGKERPTTLRDARKKDLVPSVTTILGVVAKPALNLWIQKQAILSAMKLSQQPEESVDDYVSRVIKDGQETSRQAAAEGTRIHSAIDHHYDGKDPVPAYEEHVLGTTSTIKLAYGERQWIAERAFAHEIGFGGRVDLHTDGIVLDVKTKEFESESEITNFDENLMQLAAYRVGLGMPQAVCANVFVSRTRPGLVSIQEWTPVELDRGWEMFCHLLQFWQIRNNYL